MAHWKLVLFHKAKDPPDTDAEAVVAPSIVARIGRRTQGRWRVSEAFPETKVLDVQCHVECQALAIWPAKRLSFDDGRVFIAIVMSNFHCDRFTVKLM